MNAEIYVSKTPCRHNPDVFLAVDANEIIVLHRDGVEDEVLCPVWDWTSREIGETYGELDMNQLHADAAALREMGRTYDADWLDDWANVASFSLNELRRENNDRT